MSVEPETVLSDGELMKCLARGDMEALGEIYLRHGRMAGIAIKRFAPGISAEDLDELSQDVFLALTDTARFFGDERDLKPWLYGIAVNKARNFRRAAWLREKLFARWAGERPGMAFKADTSPAKIAEIRDEVAQAFSSLPRGQVEVLALHALEGFSGEEIARILKIRPKTVWTRLHRARKTLRNAFGSVTTEIRSIGDSDEAV